MDSKKEEVLVTLQKFSSPTRDATPGACGNGGGYSVGPRERKLSSADPWLERDRFESCTFSNRFKTLHERGELPVSKVFALLSV